MTDMAEGVWARRLQHVCRAGLLSAMSQAAHQRLFSAASLLHTPSGPGLTFFQAQWRANRAGTLSTGTPLVSGSIQNTKAVESSTQPAKLRGR